MGDDMKTNHKRTDDNSVTAIGAETQSDIEQRLLQTFVPINALTPAHLKTLLRDHTIEMICRGQTLFEQGCSDHVHTYLLSGKVGLTNTSGVQETLDADDPICRFPLAQHQPRRFTAAALTDCSIIRFDSEQLDCMLAWDQASHYITLDIAGQRDLDEDADWMLTLLRSNLFYKVPPMNIRQIIDKFEAVVLTAGDTVLRQGELGDCCYFIKEGVAGVYQAADERSPSDLVAELGVGQCFGEDALVNEVGRNATIMMHSNGVLMKLDKQDFYLLLKSPPVNGVNMLEAKQKISSGSQWIDVRTQDEFENGHCPDAINMPLDLLKLKSRMLDKSKAYIACCNSGRRGEAAAHLLSEDGFNVSALIGGIANYSGNEQSYFEQIKVAKLGLANGQ